MMRKYLIPITVALFMGLSSIVYAENSSTMSSQLLPKATATQQANSMLRAQYAQAKQSQQEIILPPKQQPPQQQQQQQMPPKQQPPKQQQQQQMPPKQQPPKQQQQQPPKQQPPKQQPPKQQPPQQQGQQMPPKQQPSQQQGQHQYPPPQYPPKQQPKQQYKYQYPLPQYTQKQQPPPKHEYERNHDWDRPDYDRLSWHKHHHHPKRYISPFRWYDPWDYWFGYFRYSDFYFYGLIYDDDWNWRFPGCYSYRWYDYERDNHGFYYRGKRITQLILVFDPYDGLVGIGFMYKGVFIFIRNDMEEYYFDDEPTLFIIARILHW